MSRRDPFTGQWTDVDLPDPEPAPAADVRVTIRVETDMVDECYGHHWLVDPPSTAPRFEIGAVDYKRLIRAFEEWDWAQEFLGALIEGDADG